MVINVVNSAPLNRTTPVVEASAEYAKSKTAGAYPVRYFLRTSRRKRGGVPYFSIHFCSSLSQPAAYTVRLGLHANGKNKSTHHSAPTATTACGLGGAYGIYPLGYTVRTGTPLARTGGGKNCQT